MPTPKIKAVLDPDRRRRLDLYCATSAKGKGNLHEALAHAPPRYKEEFPARYARWMNSPITVVFGDNTDPQPVPTIVKTRPIGDKNCVVLPLNHHRHWAGVSDIVRRNDCSWGKKTPTVIWRGATTGYGRDFARKRLVSRWFGAEAKGIDVGFNVIVQGRDNMRKYRRPRMTHREQLKHKYVIAAEGNDVATNLKWILASNSVPIMPRPTVESWLLESQLVPGVHYVEVRPDFSDLDVVLSWCRAHDAACNRIAKAGQAYIAPFLQKDREHTLECAVMRKYLSG